MRNLIRFLMFSSLFFASCSKQENEVLLKQLDDIKAMGDTLPQVAMQRLDSIKPLFDNETEYLYNKLALLEIPIPQVDADGMKLEYVYKCTPRNSTCTQQ